MSDPKSDLEKKIERNYRIACFFWGFALGETVATAFWLLTR